MSVVFPINRMRLLDMRIEPRGSLTALGLSIIVAYQDLVRIFLNTAKIESFLSRLLARQQARSIKPIETTTELAEIIKSAKPAKELKKKGHPAKQIFQAIRLRSMMNWERRRVHSAGH